MKSYLFKFLLLILINTLYSKDSLAHLEDFEDKQISDMNPPKLQTINITNNAIAASDYDFYNINTSIPLKLMEIPSGSAYSSNNTCVSYPELISYNYTVQFTNFDYGGKIFPENFCYGVLTYNISRNDFFNIIEKNKNAFQNFQKLNLLRHLYSYSNLYNYNDECSGYIRNIACWSQFPACNDNGDKTWLASPICEQYCTNYQIRCKLFTIDSFCANNSTLDYCAGYQSSSFIATRLLNLFLLLLFFIYL